MSKDISKALKKKTDAQLRLLEQDAAPIVRESQSGDFFINDPNEYAQQMLAGKNIIITTAGNTKTINAVMGLLAGDNITISAPDEDGKVTITGTVADDTIKGKDVSIADFTGKDGYVLSYDETNDQFVLTEASSGGGSEYTLPQATESALGGIKAKEKTTESAEIAIDTSTGKLYTSEITLYSEGGYITEDFEGSQFLLEPLTLSEFYVISSDGYLSNSKLISSMSNSTTAEYKISAEYINSDILSFYYKTNVNNSSYNDYVWLELHIDGSLVWTTRNNNINSWQKKEISLSAGMHTISFKRNRGLKSAALEISLDKISIPNTALYGMAAVYANPDSLLLTSLDGASIGFKPMTEIMEKSQGDTLPTASEDLRGQIFTLLGGAGVADISYICQKDATDAYVWQQI